MRLQNREMVFVAESGRVLERFDIALERARTNRERARSLYVSHIHLHGC